jgi:hypothetical protein
MMTPTLPYFYFCFCFHPSSVPLEGVGPRKINGLLLAGPFSFLGSCSALCEPQTADLQSVLHLDKIMQRTKNKASAGSATSAKEKTSNSQLLTTKKMPKPREFRHL